MPEGSLGGYELTPADELELTGLKVKQAEIDEAMTMEDSETDPKPPSAVEEPVTDMNGNISPVDPLAFDDPATNFRL